MDPSEVARADGGQTSVLSSNELALSGVSSPAASSPIASSPAASSPVASSPVASSPAVSSPVASSPAVSSPAVSSPAVSSQPVYFEHRLAGVLSDAVQAGRLTAAVVATPNGLPLAAANADRTLNILAGLSSLYGEIAQRSEQLLSWPTVEEVSLVDPRGQRLVTRRFGAGELSLLLVVLVPANRTYRRVTNQAVRRLKALYLRPDGGRD